MNAIIVMGVSGSGKSTVAEALARRLRAEYLDGDDYHSRGSIEKMAAGIPLTDADRSSWLNTLARELKDRELSPRFTVLACSALKEAYRQTLRVSPEVRFLYLRGTYELIEARMAARVGHFMNPDLLRSQFATLEEPVNERDVITIDITRPVPAIVDQALEYFQPRSVS